MNTVAVFDVGKTNVKLMAVDPSGRILETVSTPNPVFPGPPYRHHDVLRLETWLTANLRVLGERHSFDAIVATGHGSGGVLIDDDGPLMPMIDYEQDPPAEIEAEYRAIAGPFRDRGSPFMLGAAHLGRQMLWLERGWPEIFARAKAYLAHPQYWAWRLSGVAAGEVTSLAAQSHIWSAVDARPTRMAVERGWERLMPPLRPAWATLGPLKPDYVKATGLGPGTRVLNGIHDSSANLYRYQAAGLSNMTVVSTGTWIIPISDRPGPDFDVEQPGLSCNTDVYGNPLPGMLVMGGREYSAVAGEAKGAASGTALGKLIATGTMALPSFGSDDCLFPGTSRRGSIAGPLADDPSLRVTLAVLYTALLTDVCLDMVDTATVVLDGSFVRDPLYGAVIAALRPDRRILVNLDQYGTVAGAALLATHETRSAPAPLEVETPPRLDLPNLPAYARRWREQAEQETTDVSYDDLAVRREMVETGRRMNASGINQGTAGNISVRDRRRLPDHPDLAALRPDAARRPRPDGFRRNLRRPPPPLVGVAVPPRHPASARKTSTWCCTAIRSTRPRSRCTTRPIPSFHYMTGIAGGTTIRCARYATFGTQALSDNAIEALQDRLACLLGQHGQISLGKTLAGALSMAIEVETIARLYVQALTLGEPPILSDEEMGRVLQQMKSMSYGQAPDLEGVNDMARQKSATT